MEFKKSPDEVYRKDGSYRQTEHIQNQVRWIELFRKANFEAHFVCSIDDAHMIIDAYFDMPQPPKMLQYET